MRFSTSPGRRSHLTGIVCQTVRQEDLDFLVLCSLANLFRIQPKAPATGSYPMGRVRRQLRTHQTRSEYALDLCLDSSELTSYPFQIGRYGSRRIFYHRVTFYNEWWLDVVKTTITCTLTHRRNVFYRVSKTALHNPTNSTFISIGLELMPSTALQAWNCIPWHHNSGGYHCVAINRKMGPLRAISQNPGRILFSWL